MAPELNSSSIKSTSGSVETNVTSHTSTQEDVTSQSKDKVTNKEQCHTEKETTNSQTEHDEHGNKNENTENRETVSEETSDDKKSQEYKNSEQELQNSQNKFTPYDADASSREEHVGLLHENTYTQSDNVSFDEPTPPVPPDGGYGWVIVFCGFMVNLLVDGMCYMGGMLYIELLDYFQESKGKTQWVHTLVPAVYLLTGPFVGALVNTFGCRKITIIGSVISSVFFIVSAMMPSVELLIFTYGIMIGLGFGLMYLPAVCFVSYYFDRRRAIATGIAVCGSGIGTFMFPPLCNFLLSEYGWRGTLLIMSGLALNCCVFGGLMRPLTASKPKPKKLEGERKKTKKEKRLEREIEQKRSIIMQKIIEQKKRQRCISSGSLDGTVITKDNKLIKDPDLLRFILQAETERNTNVSTPDLRPERKHRTISELSISCENMSSSTIDMPATPILVNKHLQHVTGTARRRSGKSEGSDMSSLTSLHKMDAQESKRLQKEMARVMYRQDIFYSGSVTNIAEFKSNPDITEYTQSVVSIPVQVELGTTNRCSPFTNVINQMFDLSLFKSVTFIVLISNAFFSFLGFFVPFMFIPDLARIMGASGNEAAMLISILGLCNTFGRIAAGWLADRPWADCLVIQNVALITGGIATALVPLMVNYALLAAYCCVFGVCMAMFIALRSIVTAEMMGVHKLNNAFGLTIFFQGLAGTAGSPLAGTIFDATGSYTISFIIAGGFITFSGIICLPLRRIARWENSKSKTIIDEYEAVSKLDLPLPDPEVGDSGKEVHFVSNQEYKSESGSCTYDV